jgi:hypothetical protein
MKIHEPPCDVSQTKLLAGYPKQIGSAVKWLRWEGKTIFRVQFTLGFDSANQGQILFVYDFAKGELLSVESYSGRCTELSPSRSIYFDVLLCDPESFYTARADLFSSKAKLSKALEAYNASGKSEQSKQDYIAAKQETDAKYAAFSALFKKVLHWGPAFATEKEQFRRFKDSYLDAYLHWKEQKQSDPDSKPEFATWLDVFDEQEIVQVNMQVASVVTAKGGPWGLETVDEKPIRWIKASDQSPSSTDSTIVAQIEASDDDHYDIANIQDAEGRHYDILRTNAGQWIDSQGEVVAADRIRCWAPCVAENLPWNVMEENNTPWDLDYDTSKHFCVIVAKNGELSLLTLFRQDGDDDLWLTAEADPYEAVDLDTFEKWAEVPMPQ